MLTDGVSDAPHRPPIRTVVDVAGGTRADLGAIGVALGLVASCGAVGRALLERGVDLQLPFPPIIAWWGPHVGPGSVPALLVLMGAAALVRVQHRLGWRRLLLVGWLLGLGWIVALALVDGDWTPILESSHEYLSELPRITDPATFLATFTDHIVAGSGAWTTHVSAHPPLATLVFWALAAVGLPGGWWAGLFCMVIGSAAAPALAQVVRDLGDPTGARRLVGFGVVFPGAVWMGVSADGMFAGVTAAGIALLTHGLVRSRASRAAAGVRQGPGLAAVALAGAGGTLLGAMLLLSYGHVLVGLLVLAILVRTRRGSGGWWWACTVIATIAVTAILGIAAAAGFWWTEGLAQLRIRYLQGIAATRPYWYFVVANLAALVVAASPLLAVAARRTVVEVAVRIRQRHRRRLPAAALVAASGLLIVLLADLSGMSKAETERIWLTFGLLVWCGLALTPGSRRRDLATVLVAGGWALAVNHLLVTGW